MEITNNEMDMIWKTFEVENQDLDVVIARKLDEILSICDQILAAPHRYSTHVIYDAKKTKEQFEKKKPFRELLVNN